MKPLNFPPVPSVAQRCLVLLGVVLPLISLVGAIAPARAGTALTPGTGPWLLSQRGETPNNPSNQPSSDDNQSDLGNPGVLEIVPAIESPRLEVNRTALNRRMQQAEPGTAITMFEELQAFQYASYFGWNLFGEIDSVEQVSLTLGNLARRTGQKPALIYAISYPDYLELLLVLPRDGVAATSRALPQVPGIPMAAAAGLPGLLGQANPPQGAPVAEQFVIRKQIPAARAKALNPIAKEFRRQVSDPSKTRSTSYLKSAQQLYEWLMTPLLPELRANQITTLVFCLDAGLRSLPLAALHDGQQFLIEQYSLALIPSFSLTDTRYENVKGTPMLAVGISDAVGGQSPLPAVAVEVPTLTQKIWQGTPILNQEATTTNLTRLARQQRFNIVHLATHGEFRSGEANNSFIQFWDTKLRLLRLRQLAQEARWNVNPTVDLLVLSACQTALGDQQAELGFTGLAVQAGVKTALGSLWYVSDAGSLALMTGFYTQLRTAPIKAAALRQAQLAMLRGQIRLVGGQLQLPDQMQFPLPAAIAAPKDLTFSHPYFWSAYTLVGNWN